MPATALLSSLSSPVRVDIVLLLEREGALCVNDVAARVGASQCNVSHHLTILNRAGATKSERQMNKKMYSIRDQRVAQLVRLAAEVADGV
jgi:ArsR family transcriptional regulator